MRTLIPHFATSITAGAGRLGSAHRIVTHQIGATHAAGGAAGAVGLVAVVIVVLMLGALGQTLRRATELMADVLHVIMSTVMALATITIVAMITLILLVHH
jgi:hypothetical protein